MIPNYYGIPIFHVSFLNFKLLLKQKQKQKTQNQPPTPKKWLYVTRWWFQIFFIFTPITGRFPFWLIFFRWVETTNQVSSHLRFKQYHPSWLIGVSHFVTGGFYRNDLDGRCSRCNTNCKARQGTFFSGSSRHFPCVSGKYHDFFWYFGSWEFWIFGSNGQFEEMIHGIIFVGMISCHF